MNLEEALAWLEKMLELHVRPCGQPDCGECLRDTRAAIREVALAAIQLTGYHQEGKEQVYRSKGYMKAEIDRLFPPRGR